MLQVCGHERHVGGRKGAVSIDAKVDFLSRPDSYPGRAAGIDVRETHMSWVFLTAGRVYKLKKPVRFPYLDFSSLGRREAACRAEFLLNRRLARDVYLGVLPLRQSTEGLALDGDGRVVDWLVVMRRLREGNLEDVARLGLLNRSEVARVASVLGRFYARARRVPVRPQDHIRTWVKSIDYNRRLLLDRRFGLPVGLIHQIWQIQRRFLEQRPELIARRVRRQWIIDAHGDLRPEHIWLGKTVRIIDCLEFDPRLRALDPLDEVAFLHLELERLGVAWAGEMIRHRLARLLDDERGSGLFLFYRCHRAMLRARLAISHLLDVRPRTPEKWPVMAQAYLHLAKRDASKLEVLIKRSGGLRAICSDADGRWPRPKRERQRRSRVCG